MLTLSGLGDACDPNDPASSDAACSACGGTPGIPGTCAQASTTTSSPTVAPPVGVTPQFNYSSWNCTQCGPPQISDPNQISLCQNMCGNAAAQSSVSSNLTANAVSSLPGGASVSSIPGLPGIVTVSGAINWWGFGLATLVGLGTAVGLFVLAHRRT